MNEVGTLQLLLALKGCLQDTTCPLHHSQKIKQVAQSFERLLDFDQDLDYEATSSEPFYVLWLYHIILLRNSGREKEAEKLEHLQKLLERQDLMTLSLPGKRSSGRVFRFTEKERVLRLLLLLAPKEYETRSSEPLLAPIENENENDGQCFDQIQDPFSCPVESQESPKGTAHATSLFRALVSGRISESSKSLSFSLSIPELPEEKGEGPFQNIFSFPSHYQETESTPDPIPSIPEKEDDTHIQISSASSISIEKEEWRNHLGQILQMLLGVETYLFRWREDAFHLYRPGKYHGTTTDGLIMPEIMDMATSTRRLRHKLSFLRSTGIGQPFSSLKKNEDSCSVWQGLASSIEGMLSKLDFTIGDLQTTVTKSKEALSVLWMKHQLQQHEQLIISLCHICGCCTCCPPSPLPWGPACLSVIYQATASLYGLDEEKADGMYQVLRKSSEGYLSMLSRWLETGHCDDPHDECFLTDKKGVPLNREIPIFLRPIARNLADTGKALRMLPAEYTCQLCSVPPLEFPDYSIPSSEPENITRCATVFLDQFLPSKTADSIRWESDEHSPTLELFKSLTETPPEMPKRMEPQLSLGDQVIQSLYTPVLSRYKEVTKVLHHFYVRDIGLLRHINFLRKFCLLASGAQSFCSDLFTSTEMTSVSRELSIGRGRLHLYKFNSLLQQYLQEADPQSKENLSIAVSTPNKSDWEYSWMSWAYRPQGILSEIINEDCMYRHNLIFNRLLKFKHARWLLNQTWLKAKKETHPNININSLSLLRSEMEHFVIIMESYMHQQIAYCWQQLKAILVAEDSPHLHNVKECIQTRYLDPILRRCFIDKGPIAATIDQLVLIIIHSYQQQQQRVKGRKNDASSSSAGNSYRNSMRLLLTLLEQQQSLTLTADTRVSHKKNKDHPSSTSTPPTGLLVALNFNGFYLQLSIDNKRNFS